MMHVVVVNGSPKMEKGYTDRILKPFVEGMRNAGAQVEVLYAKNLDIKPCKGEFHCWNEELGVCIIKDDMEFVMKALKKADILVLATPVYIPIPGEMQNFLNRLCPLINPVLKRRNGRTRARLHDDVRIKKIVLVSTCGWREMGNFGTVLRIAKELAEDLSIEFAGALLRPHSYALQSNSSKAEWVYDAARRAGHDLIAKGKLRKDVLAAASRPLVSSKNL